MNVYPIVEPAGFVIDAHTAALIVLMDNIRKNNCSEAVKKLLATNTPMNIISEKLIPEDETDDYYDTQHALEILNDNVEGVVFAPDFDGEVDPMHAYAHPSFPLPVEENYADELIVYLEPDRQPDYFAQAYESIDDLVAEYKEKLILYLPDDFPIKRNIVKITGTYFC